MGLSTCHGEVNVCQDLGVEQGAVQHTAGVIYSVTLAERIEAVALTRVSLPRHRQGIENRAMLSNIRAIGLPCNPEFGIYESDVERCVVDDKLGTFDEVEELIGHILETRLTNKCLVGNTVNRDGALVDIPIGLQVDMKMSTCQSTSDDFHRANLDNAVAIRDRHTGGFGIQHNDPVAGRLLAHALIQP